MQAEEGSARRASEILRALIAPIAPEDFQREFWPEQPFVVHGPLERLPAPFTDPLLRDLAALSRRYNGRILFGRGSRGPRSVLARELDALELHRMGLALYLPDVEPVLAGATDFLRGLEHDLGLAPGDARMTVWTAPAGEGIACHFDAEEVFSVQITGAKSFEVGEPAAMRWPVGMQYGPGIPPTADLYPQVAAGFPDPADAVFNDIPMSPGSLVFLPRGHWHRTRSTEDSLSISVILSPASAADLALRALRLLLLQDSDWRRPLYGQSSGVGPLLAQLPDIAAQLRPGDLLGQKEGAERFQRNPQAMPIPDGSLAAAGRDVANWVGRSRGAFALSDVAAALPGLSETEIRDALDGLTSAGCVTRLWFPALRAAPSAV